MQQIKYASTAWNDIKNSPGWKGKVAILALLQFIPIFGQLVLFGYIYGWARDIAWGVHAPLPDKIFGNEDGKLYSRGFFILVILFVFSLVPGVVSTIGGTFTGGAVGLGLARNADAAGAAFALMFGSVFALIEFVLLLAVYVFWGIGAMRTAIYDRISAGFQLNKIWAMLRHDTNGVLRILGMAVLISILFGIVLSLLIGILVIVVAGISIPGLMFVDSTADFLEYLASFGPAFVILVLLLMVIGFFGSMVSVVISMMVARASGYWTQQFNVAQWRGQDDPMPFELVQMQQQQQYQQQPPAAPGV